MSESNQNSSLGGLKFAYTLSELESGGVGCRSDLYEAMRDGRLKAHKRGSRTVVFPEDLAAYLATLPRFEPGAISHLAKARTGESSLAVSTAPPPRRRGQRPTAEPT